MLLDMAIAIMRPRRLQARCYVATARCYVAYVAIARTRVLQFWKNT